MDVPSLTRAAIAQAITKMSRHGRTFLAIYGDGEAGTVQLEGKGTVKVVPVRSELELREKLPPLGEHPYRAYLVPFHGNLPDDIGGRFIGNGKIERIGRMQQLASLTGTSDADPEASETKLAGYLMRSDNPTTMYPVQGQKASRSALFTAWLATDWKVPVDGGLALDTFLGWAASDARGPAFVAAMGDAAASGVEAELVQFLRGDDVLGALGAVVLRAWMRGRAADLLAFAAIAEVVDKSDESGPGHWLRQKLRQIAEIPEGAEPKRIVAQLAELARPVFSWLKRRDDGLVRRVLEQAEQLVDEPDIAKSLVASHRLPRAWTLRLEALSDALCAVVSLRTRDTLELARNAFKDLEHHEYFVQEEKSALVRRSEFALRLAAWLVARPDKAISVPAHSYGAVEALGAWYVAEGGYVDWARRMVRGLAGTPVAAGAKALVEAADAERTMMDRRFSEGLSHWIHAGRPSKNVLPIDKALERVAARFVEQRKDSSLLILLMDGMAWAQAVELLPSLAEGGRLWGPVAWSESPQNRIGEGRYPVMLGALPTVTEISRSAFFAGKLMNNGTSLNTAKDPEHFGANRHMAAFLESHLRPKLLLRGEGHTKDGALTEEALTMIKASREQRVAAIVINAIDASLKGDSQQEHRWNIDSIRSLPQIFDAAREAGRHVLLVADHGHVPADRLKSIGPGNGGGARYRRWTGDSDVLALGERKFSGEGVYLPKGDSAVVLLEDDGTRYGGAPHAGEHGGSAMAEVIAPCVLLGWDNNAGLPPQDKDLDVRGFYVPEWWSGSLPAERAQEVDRAARTPRRTKASAVENQPSLFAPEQGEQPTRSPSTPSPSQRSTRALAKPAELLPALFGSKMLQARAPLLELKNSVVVAVHFLLSRPGGVPAAVFATHMNVPTFRVQGLVSKLQEVLNLDGYEILKLERAHQTIFLDTTKLEQQFEVKL
jgi:hypothetical protein